MSDPYARALSAIDYLFTPDLGPVARNAMVMWYLGQWDPMPATWRERHGMHPEDDARVVSAAAWRAGLVWQAIRSHPMGAQPTGFASWAEPPRTP